MENIFWIQVSIPLIAVFVNIAFQIIIVRFLPKIGLLKSIFIGFFVGLIGVIAGEIYIFSNFQILNNMDFLGIFVVNLITYCCLGYCYFHFLNLGETARRIRILIELYNERKRGMSLEEILNRYNSNVVIQNRINRLVSNRQIILKQDRYYIGNPCMLLMAKMVIALKLLIFGEKRSQY